VNAAKPPVELHVISDSTGETAVRLVHALEAQFPEQEFEEIRHPRVETVDDLHLAPSCEKPPARSAGATSSTTATCSAIRSRPWRASRASPRR
jgi:regulator of PEP synthase PpsR (kinase-PPPase family)